ncbi:MAG TPA: glycosyltransferase [Terriglobales bacterium]|nr:glycosyltransferase [Terriglobales bacterium]
MQVLFFSPRSFWPANSGARIRDYYLLRALASRASVSFLGICGADQDAAPPSPACGLTLATFNLAPKKRGYSLVGILRGFAGPTPINILNYWDQRVAHGLRQLLQEHTFDIVQMEGIHLASYLPIIRSARSRIPVVCDWHDVESDRMSRFSAHAPGWAQRLYARRTSLLLRKAESRLLQECEAHVVVSDRDASLLRELSPQASIHVIENGVDVGYYLNGNGAAEAPGFAARHHIVFVGSMDFQANVDAARYFALEVWPQLQATNPQFRFVIVGSRPLPQVQELARLPGVTVTGTVDDVRPYYAQAFAAIAPLRVAGGTRLKILEAMAAGVPLVSTTIGAEGLAAVPGRHLLLGDSPQQLLAALVNLRNSPRLWHSLSQAGRELVSTRYDWPKIGSSLYDLHCALLKTSQ